MKRRLFLFLLFLIIQCQGGEITAVVGEKTSLLKKTKFSKVDWHGSISFAILNMPSELKTRILGKFFNLSDKEINTVTDREISNNAINFGLKHFYRTRLLDSGCYNFIRCPESISFTYDDFSQSSINRQNNIIATLADVEHEYYCWGWGHEDDRYSTPGLILSENMCQRMRKDFEATGMTIEIEEGEFDYLRELTRYGLTNIGTSSCGIVSGAILSIWFGSDALCWGGTTMCLGTTSLFAYYWIQVLRNGGLRKITSIKPKLNEIKVNI